jgi:5'-nucleotidase
MLHVHLTNDDGIRAKGVWYLYDALLDLADPVVFTPLRKRTGLSKSVSLGRLLKVRKVRVDSNHEGWAVDGTPADTVILYNKVAPDKPPDLVISGINDQYNLGLLSILTSGTLGACYQAALSGVPSLGFAIGKLWNKPTIRAAAEASKQIVKVVAENGLPEGVDVLNINFPPRISNSTPLEVTDPILAAVRVTIDEKWSKTGERGYRVNGVLLDKFNAPPGSDWFAVKNKNAISVTPLSIGGIVSRDSMEEVRILLQDAF